MKSLTLLGSTGSIGTSTLDVVRRNQSIYEVFGLAAGHNIEAIQPSRDVLAACDMAIVITNHTAFDYKEIVKNAQLVFDTRNATGELKATNLVRL